MALIAMAVYSTEENKKDDCLYDTLYGLYRTVDFDRHRLMLSVNGYTFRTQEIIGYFSNIIEKVISNDSNIGTAKAVNKIWQLRKPGEHAVKMDDDITIHYNGWADDMEEAIKVDPLIGQIGLKRRDLWEYPGNPNPDYASELIMLPHVPGENWLVVEKVKHCIGSCVMHSSALLDKVGYLYQLSTYGFDDVIMSHRTHLAGFYSCFFPYIKIDHTDPGNTEYQAWKEKHSGEHILEMVAFVQAMYRKEKPYYYES